MSREEDQSTASSAAAIRDALDASRLGGGKQGGIDFAECLCCDCNKFGPWGDGTFRYCEDHVPPDLRFADQAFKDKLARNAHE